MVLLVGLGVLLGFVVALLLGQKWTWRDSGRLFWFPVCSQLGCVGKWGWTFWVLVFLCFRALPRPGPRGSFALCFSTC